MLHVLQNLFHRPAIRLGVMEDARGLCRNPRFASFMVQCNRKALDTHYQGHVLRARRLVRHAVMLALLIGGAWIALESARALAVF
jgi:hypothetical protein